MSEEKSIAVFDQRAIDRKLDDVSRAKAYLETIVVTDVASAQVAADWLGDLQKEAKAVEEMKQTALRPMRETERTIREWFRAVEQTIAEAIAGVKGKLGRYELDARDKQRAAFAEAAAAHAAGDHVAARAAVEVSNAHAAQRSAKGASAREVWSAQVVDASAVPRDWCVPDTKRIDALARSTPASAAPVAIPGVEFARKVIVTGRPRK